MEERLGAQALGSGQQASPPGSASWVTQAHLSGTHLLLYQGETTPAPQVIINKATHIRLTAQARMSSLISFQKLYRSEQPEQKTETGLPGRWEQICDRAWAPGQGKRTDLRGPRCDRAGGEDLSFSILNALSQGSTSQPCTQWRAVPRCGKGLGQPLAA